MKKMLMVGIAVLMMGAATARDLIFSYYISNKTDRKYDSIALRAAESEQWTTVQVKGNPDVAGWLIKYRGGFKALGRETATGVTAGWRTDYSGTDSFTITVPVRGLETNANISNGCAVYLRVKWQDGSSETYCLPFPWGDVNLHYGCAYVTLGISGKGLFYTDKRIEAE